MQIKIKVRSKSLNTDFSIQISSNFNMIGIKKERNKIQSQNYQTQKQIYKTPNSLQKYQNYQITKTKINEPIIQKNAPNNLKEYTFGTKIPQTTLKSFQLKNNFRDKVQPFKKDPIKQYEDQIFAHLERQSLKFQINPKVLINLSFLSKVRIVLIKSIFKLVNKFQCKRRTLHLSVYCLDFYLSKNCNLNENKMILLSKACLHIGMKFEQIYPPSINQFTIDQKQQMEVIKFEAKILKAMNFQLNYPSIAYFEQYFIKNFNKKDYQCYQQSDKRYQIYLNQQRLKKIKLIGDLCLFDAQFYKYSPFDIELNIFKIVYKIQPLDSHKQIVQQICRFIDKNQLITQWIESKMNY